MKISTVWSSFSNPEEESVKFPYTCSAEGQFAASAYAPHTQSLSPYPDDGNPFWGRSVDISDEFPRSRRRKRRSAALSLPEESAYFTDSTQKAPSQCASQERTELKKLQEDLTSLGVSLEDVLEDIRNLLLKHNDVNYRSRQSKVLQRLGCCLECSYRNIIGWARDPEENTLEVVQIVDPTRIPVELEMEKGFCADVSEEDSVKLPYTSFAQGRAAASADAPHSQCIELEKVKEDLTSLGVYLEDILEDIYNLLIRPSYFGKVDKELRRVIDFLNCTRQKIKKWAKYRKDNTLKLVRIVDRMKISRRSLQTDILLSQEVLAEALSKDNYLSNRELAKILRKCLDPALEVWIAWYHVVLSTTLTDLKWSPTTTANSGDLRQSLSYMSTLEVEEKTLEPPQLFGIEAESTYYLDRTKGESSQCEVQSEREDIEKDEKSRAYLGNLTTSAEIEHMTVSTKLRDFTLDPFEQTDELFSVPVPVNLVDSNSTQRELSVASSISLRQDVLDLGFHSFDLEFDPERVLCIYTASQDAVEILFFHVEGMAVFFGVGLSFSRVLLQEDGVVEVQQLQKGVWMNSWSKSETANFSLVLLNSTVLSTSTFGLDSAPRNMTQLFSPKEAAEKFGVGLEGGDRYIRMGEFQPDVSSVPAISPSWIGSLYGFLRYKGHARNNAGGKEVGSQQSHYSVSTTTDLSVPSSSGSVQGTNPDEDLHRNQRQELPEVTTAEQGIQSQPRHLTVIIRLDPGDCTFLAHTEDMTLMDKAADEMRLVKGRFIRCQTNDPSTKVDPALCNCSMVPEVTIKFLYHPSLQGSNCKKMTTTLDVKFYLEGKLSRDDEFGWYHDQLRLSFECERPEDVRRESRGTEILSKLENRSADIGGARANSTTELRGKGKEHQLAVGYNIVSGKVGRNSKYEDTVGRSESHELSSKISSLCLEGKNFCILEVGGPSKLAYLATMFPPFHQFDIWDRVSRRFALASGMMSAVPIRIEGDWEVLWEKDDDLYPSNSPAGSSGEFCKYEFSCERELKLHRLKHVSLGNGPEITFETKEEVITLHQKLLRSFLVNHSFSHMQRLERPRPYVWDLLRKPQSPCPQPADQMLKTEPQQWQRPLPSS